MGGVRMVEVKDSEIQSTFDAMARQVEAGLENRIKVPGALLRYYASGELKRLLTSEATRARRHYLEHDERVSLRSTCSP